MNPTPSLHLRFASFELDEGNARLWHAGKVLALTPKAFGVLCTLARQRGQLVTKDGLLDAVWGHRHVSESVLKTTISELRAVLGDDARRPRYIETASRRGYRFIGEAAATPAASAAQPPQIQGVSRQAADAPRMIGRQAALAKLRALWDRALAGERQIVWVVGEAGVGKTTLIREFLDGIDPLVWSHGQCVEQYGAGEPYLPFLEGLGVLCQRDPSLPARLRAGAPTWLMQMPLYCSEAERAALRQELVGATQERMARELRECTDLYSMTHPLLFVTEDLHWSDGATLRMLDYLARHKGPARGMWLSSFRLTEVLAGDHPLKAIRHELRLHGLATEIALDSFSEREVGEYLADRHPRVAAAESFVRALHQHTDGLPLFVARVVEDLAAQGALERAPEPDAISALDVPENLAGVIERQLARLPAETRRLLEGASVCGLEFRARTLAEVLDLEVAHVTQECERLAQRQQWLAARGVERLADGALDARYGFRHALYKRALYQGIGALTRAQLHQRAAESIQRARDQGVLVSLAELASHYELAHDPLPALRHYAEAAEQAVRHFAPQEALALTERATQLLGRLPESPDRAQFELRLSLQRGVLSSQRQGMSSDAAGQAYERAQALSQKAPESAAQGWVLGGLGQVHYGRAEYEAALSAGLRIQDIAERHGERALEIMSCTLIGMCGSARGDREAGRHWLQRGMEVLEVLGEGLPQARFFVDPGVTMGGHLALELLALGRVEQARDCAGRTLARGRSRGHAMAEALSIRCAALLDLELGEYEAASAKAAALRAIADAHGIVQAQGNSRLITGLAQAHLGEPAEGVASILEGQAIIERIGMSSGSSRGLGFAAEALRLAGRTREAGQQLDAASAFAQRTGECFYLPELLITRARIAAACADTAAAREACAASIAEARRQGAVWPELAAWIARCQIDGAGPADRAGLAQACARISGGGDTPALRQARALLG